jgi:hypothetical protein
MEGAPSRQFRLGHSLAVFGIFLSIVTLTLSSVNAPRTVAFGTSEVGTLSNQYRSSAGLAPLTTNGLLTSSAQAKANHMANNGYFAHDAPDGTTPWFFFDQSGYGYLTAGENLALTNQSASSVVDGWYNSPGHRANMLSTSYTEVGYGIAFVPSFTYNGTTYANVYLVAAHYAKPVVAQAAPAPPPAPPVQEVASESVTQPEPVPEVVAEEPAPIETQQDQVPVAGGTDIQSGNTTSGTMAVASTSQPKLSATLAYVGLGIGVLLVVVGVAIETRRFIHHQPLLPHH